MRSRAPSYVAAGSPARPARRAPRAWIRRLAAMSGHSKWASIKHKKAIVDSRRGAAVLQADACDHRGRTRRRRRPGRQPCPGPGDPQGQGSLHAEGQHRARDRQGHRRGKRRRGDRGDPLRGLRAGRRGGARRGAHREPQPHLRRGQAHLLQERRQPRRAGLRGLPVREEGHDRDRRGAILRR